MSEGVIQPDGKSVVFPGPEMEGFDCEVQHTMSTGKPYTAERGMMGFGVVTLPTGQPRVVMQVRHPDGESLSVTLTSVDVALLASCLFDAAGAAQEQADAVQKASRQ